MHRNFLERLAFQLLDIDAHDDAGIAGRHIGGECFQVQGYLEIVVGGEAVEPHGIRRDFEDAGQGVSCAGYANLLGSDFRNVRHDVAGRRVEGHVGLDGNVPLDAGVKIQVQKQELVRRLYEHHVRKFGAEKFLAPMCLRVAPSSASWRSMTIETALESLFM